MPSPSPEPALRRMVSNLAMLHADDIAAILGALSAKERAAVEGLLREHAAIFGTAPEPTPPPSTYGFDAARLSPWLAQRSQASEAFAMTDAARQALAEIAARLFPAPAASGALVPFARMTENSSLGRAKP